MKQVAQRGHEVSTLGNTLNSPCQSPEHQQLLLSLTLLEQVVGLSNLPEVSSHLNYSVMLGDAAEVYIRHISLQVHRGVANT